MAATDLVALLDFLAPAVAGATPEEKQMALDLAAPYRPACLTEAQQDEAQVWYAASLLYQRMQQSSSGVVPVGVASEKEGDLARSYGKAGGGADASSDPAGFYDRYKALADLCGVGAIIVGFPRHAYCQDH